MKLLRTLRIRLLTFFLGKKPITRCNRPARKVPLDWHEKDAQREYNASQPDQRIEGDRRSLPGSSGRRHTDERTEYTDRRERRARNTLLQDDAPPTSAYDSRDTYSMPRDPDPDQVGRDIP